MLDQHKTNLILLAERLESLPANYSHFNMRFFFNTDPEYNPDRQPGTARQKDLHTCGAVACALGHAPTIKGLKAKRDETWGQYSDRVFGLNDNVTDGGWDFLFEPDWASVKDQDTAHAAARRIRYLVANGGNVPDRDMWEEVCA